MKILESQSAVLANYEVYEHLLNEQAKYQKNHERKKQVPKSLQTVIREVSLCSSSMHQGVTNMV